jgi:isoamylase
LTVRSVIGTRMVHAILNGWQDALEFELPPVAVGTGPWRRLVDTSLDPPDDVAGLSSGTVVRETTYTAGAHSVVLLSAELK